MMTHAELTKLEQDLRGRKVLSVYVNGDIADAAARGQWRTELKNALDAIEGSLRGATHAEREGFAKTRELVVTKLADFTPGEDSPGWVGFFSEGQAYYDGVVPVPVPTQATWTEGANLGPCIRVLKETRPVFVVVADSAHVRIHRYADRLVTHVETFESQPKVDQPYFMSRPAPQGFSSGTRGRPGAEAAQRETRKATELMLSAAAEKIEELAGKDARVLIGGIPVAATALHGRLGKNVSPRARVITLDVHATDAMLAESAREHASRIREAEDIERIEQVVAAKAQGGTGAVGVKDTARALVNGQVRELYVTSAFVQKNVDQAVDAIRRAFDEGATVEHMSGNAAQKLDAAGGIAARLRFSIASDGASA